MSDKSLTRRDQEIVDFLSSYRSRHGSDPSLGEIAQELVLSKVAAFDYVSALSRRGVITFRLPTPLYINPFDDRSLLQYYNALLKWHGYIRFLGLPHLSDNPDVSIEKLYIEPSCSERRIDPDLSVDEWLGVVPILDAVAQERCLVLLGDPGCGKSTLVSWITYRLTQGNENAWTRALGQLVPFPMVLRDLHLEACRSWSDVLDAFLAHDFASPLRDRSLVEELLSSGQAFVFLDGLDEVSDVHTREALRDAVHEGMRRYPCRWLLTSRVVGYDEVPFHKRKNTIPLFVDDRIEASVRYVAPFGDHEIERFSENWYRQREAETTVARSGATRFLQAVRANPSTLRLARVPNLLTMMALIHRIRARLPHGRALLYNEIAQAYLESIDTYRGVDSLDYPLREKKRWLALVAFRMQRRRAEHGDGREILIRGNELREWIAEAMSHSSLVEDAYSEASLFVDYIGRRSGLLLPRGPDEFSFMHLSFQEYFAAFFLSDKILAPGWGSGRSEGAIESGTAPASLREAARNDVWQETFVLLFELMADLPGWSEELMEIIVGRGFEFLQDEDAASQPVVLLALLIADPHAGLSSGQREAAQIASWKFVLRQQSLEGDTGAVVRALMGTDPNERKRAWTTLESAWVDSERDRGYLSLSGTGVSDLAPLAKLTGLQRLNLNGTSVSDLAPLAKLTGLQYLYLDGTGVSDLAPLAKLTGLQRLDLDGTGVSDLAPLAKLTGLQHLNLNRTSVSDLAPLAKLTRLQYLYLDGTGVSDLAPLAKLTGLQFLYLDGTGVSDLAPLAKLTGLQYLNLDGTGVSDLAPLAKLTGLQRLDLDDTSVCDLAPLAKLTRLHVFGVEARERVGPDSG